MSSQSGHVPYRRPLLLLGAVLSSLALRAWAQDRARLRTAQEFKSVHSKLVPALVPLLRSPLEPDSRQAFLIPGQDGHTLRMIPVKYDSLTEATGNTNYRCGIFFAPESGPVVFVPKLGYDFTEVLECGSLSAVGFMNVSGEVYPRLLLVYDAGTINGYGPAPVILEYSATKGDYVPNEKLSTRTFNRGGPITIARMKKSLQSEPN